MAPAQFKVEIKSNKNLQGPLLPLIEDENEAAVEKAPEKVSQKPKKSVRFD